MLQYQHCALRAADVWTVAPRPSPQAQLSALEAFIAREIDDEEDA